MLPPGRPKVVAYFTPFDRAQVEEALQQLPSPADEIRELKSQLAKVGGGLIALAQLNNSLSGLAVATARGHGFASERQRAVQAHQHVKLPVLAASFGSRLLSTLRRSHGAAQLTLRGGVAAMRPSQMCPFSALQKHLMSTRKARLRKALDAREDEAAAREKLIWQARLGRTPGGRLRPLPTTGVAMPCHPLQYGVRA